MVASSMAVQGYCFGNLDLVTRLLFLAASLGMVTRDGSDHRLLERAGDGPFPSIRFTLGSWNRIPDH